MDCFDAFIRAGNWNIFSIPDFSGKESKHEQKTERNGGEDKNIKSKKCQEKREMENYFWQEHHFCKKFSPPSNAKPTQNNAKTPLPSPAATPIDYDTFVREWSGKPAGLYDSDTKKMTKSWDDLVSDGNIEVSEESVLSSYIKGDISFNKCILVIKQGIKVLQ